jgi:hypothetical protein
MGDRVVLAGLSGRRVNALQGQATVVISDLFIQAWGRTPNPVI